MDTFYMNGIFWRVFRVDPTSPLLVDRTDTLRVATTDPNSRCIYLSSAISGDFLTRVFIHELGHVAIFSFNLLDDIHRMVLPEYWIEAEEWICNFLADFGLSIFRVAYTMLGDRALYYVPYEMERMIAA